MIFTIESNDTTHSCSERFKAAFPGLDLRFVAHSHGEGEGSASGEIIATNLPISELVQNDDSTSIEVNAEMTVSQVEQLFEDNGLHIQVFVDLGGTWIETTATDHYSLKKQMERSAERKN
jgi:hypothetical protein